jgi:biotin carboxyl carrier protein
MKRAQVRDRATGEVAATVTVETDAPSRDAVVLVGAPSAAVGGRAGRESVEVVLDGWRFEFEVEDADRAALRARATVARDAQAAHGPMEVRAIIPGRVLTVAVTRGDVVTAGQQLLTVEAMKMQNELRSPRDGTVDRVSVGPGATVEPGDILVILG